MNHRSQRGQNHPELAMIGKLCEIAEDLASLQNSLQTDTQKWAIKNLKKQTREVQELFFMDYIKNSRAEESEARSPIDEKDDSNRRRNGGKSFGRSDCENEKDDISYWETDAGFDRRNRNGSFSRWRNDDEKSYYSDYENKNVASSQTDVVEHKTKIFYCGFCRMCGEDVHATKDCVLSIREKAKKLLGGGHCWKCAANHSVANCDRFKNQKCHCGSIDHSNWTHEVAKEVERRFAVKNEDEALHLYKKPKN